MAKTVVFCADGTWNGPGGDDNDDPNAHFTNVYKLFLNLDGDDTPETSRLGNEQERIAPGAGGAAVQCAKYLHGVGDSTNALVHLLGGGIGAGTIARIVRGYTYVSRNYQPGDRIVLIGFSRGAYTARALAGLIAARGLLDGSRIDLTDKDNAYRLGSAVWYHWRRESLSRAGGGLLGFLENFADDLPAFVSADPTADLIAPVPIDTVAVWDTVGALGIPDYVRDDAGGTEEADLFRFADTQLSADVAHGLHALARDEQRASFTPTLWDADARIEQRIFPGAHADVGGGYPREGGESGLSDGALVWMTTKLVALGAVRFAASPTVVPAPNPLGPAHRPWLHPPFDLLPTGKRAFPPSIPLDGSVAARQAGGPVVPDPGTPPEIYT